MEYVNNEFYWFCHSPALPRDRSVESFSSSAEVDTFERRRRSWSVDEPHVRNQSNGSERYFARRRSNGDERNCTLSVDGITGFTVVHDVDGSSLAKRWLQLIA